MAPFRTSQTLPPAAAPHAEVPVTIPLVTVTQEGEPIVAPAAPLILRLFPAARTKLMSPVDADPRLRVCLLVVPMLPDASSVRALLVEIAEREAVGVPLFTLIKA